MENLLLWAFYVLTFYAFLPGIVSRTFGFRVFKKGLANREIALTFDDGPDEIYTRKLLDLLKKHGAKATFFVVGANAEKYPDIIRRMHEEGHIIGIHNYVHKTNWLMRPKTVKNQIVRTAAIIRSATGVQPVYYRPPWGIVNLFDFSNLGFLQIILWSSMFGDWRKKVGTERLTRRMMKKLRGGEVLLLHDCGHTFGADADAPQHMIEALDLFLDAAADRGFRTVGIDEMIRLTDANRSMKAGLFKRAVVDLWMLWEKCFQKLFHIRPIGSPNDIFHVRVRPYTGENIQLDDGEMIQPGDRIVELHFDNRQLYEMGMRSKTAMRTAIQLIRAVERMMPKLAETMLTRPEFDGVKGLYGITLINRGPEQLGFSVIDLPKGWFAKMTKLYLRLLMRVIHPSGKKRLKERTEMLVPKIIAMSTKQLYERYYQDFRPMADSMKKEAIKLSLPTAVNETGLGKPPLL